MRVPRPVLTSAAVVLAAVVAAGCSGAGPSASGPPGPGPSSTRPAPTSPTVPAPTTTTTIAAPTTTTYAPTDAQPSPDAAAARFIDVWSTGNRATAASVATPAAIQTLFATPFPFGWIQPRGCTAASTNPGTCTYRNTETNWIYEITVVRGPTGWYVSAVTPES